jgi:A/G-specific adenine glycosylase
MDINKINNFRSFIWNFYHENRREFAWRNIDNAYHVMISEIMLQQTQTHRVITKYQEFLDTFPTVELLAQASLRDVLLVWQGLGYYRRARFLHCAAQIIVEEHGGCVPEDPEMLQRLPGIGIATAASICAFAFNKPTVFIETNIRTVFIHSFFREREDVSDKEIIPFVAASVDRDNPREWYYALMDYGVFLKAQHVNPSRKSAHYSKQTKFEGSDRQIRAAILKLVADKGAVDVTGIYEIINRDNNRIEKILKALENDEFIIKNAKNQYCIV